MELTSPNVRKVFEDCLFRDEEIKAAGGENPPFIGAEGITMKVGFHPQRLESHRADVSSMLSDLSDDFMHNKGGGMSFLNGCVTKSGEQWGEHQNMEQLFMLGMALGLVRSLMPRTMWRMLPGGMPYYVVNPEGFPKEEPAKQD
jgi:hypothetical protein